jgi:hypothetical protein
LCAADVSQHILQEGIEEQCTMPGWHSLASGFTLRPLFSLLSQLCLCSSVYSTPLCGQPPQAPSACSSTAGSLAARVLFSEGGQSANDRRRTTYHHSSQLMQQQRDAQQVAAQRWTG